MSKGSHKTSRWSNVVYKIVAMFVCIIKN